MTTTAELEERLRSGGTVTVGEYIHAMFNELFADWDRLREMGVAAMEEAHLGAHKVRRMLVVNPVYTSVYCFKPSSIHRRIYAYLNRGGFQ